MTIAVYLVGSISGAHINPAVTLGFAAYGGFLWKKVPGFIIAQVIGAFLGGGIVYVLFGPIINIYNAAHHTTRAAVGGLTSSGIFMTHQNTGVTMGLAFVDKNILTAVLMIGILAVVEKFNGNRPGANMRLYDWPCCCDGWRLRR